MPWRGEQPVPEDQFIHGFTPVVFLVLGLKHILNGKINYTLLSLLKNF